MRKEWKIFIIIIVSIITPIIIGWGVSQDILNEWTNSNDWIGFWGNYAGAVIGSFVTLFVMYETNRSGREDLEISIKHNKEMEERQEKLKFCELIIGKVASLTENVEETVYRAHDSRNFNDSVEHLQSFSKQFRMTRAVTLELYMYFEIKKEQNNYIPEQTGKIAELLSELHEKLEEYYEEFLQDKDVSIYDKELFDMINVIAPTIKEYAKELSKS